MSELIQVEKDEYEGLVSEIKWAHDKLTELGVGKEHWSLAGRIDAMVTVYVRKAIEIVRSETNNLELEEKLWSLTDNTP